MSEYEYDKDGTKQLVRSLDVSQRSFLRFINVSKRPVDVYWINFVGNAEKCRTLRPEEFFDANTYTSHPWIFKDAVTQERYVVNNQKIFRGQSNVKVTPPYSPHRPQRSYIARIKWNITAPLRSLKLASLVTLAECITDEKAAHTLDLPKTLADELDDMIALYNRR